MTTTTTASTKLLCPECRRENEPERIYCHECGTRLDRSAVRLKKEPIQDTHKRVKRMFDPHRAKLRALSFTVSKVVVGAAVVAVMVDMFLPPDVPAPSKNQVLVSSIRFDLEGMVTKRHPNQRQITDEEANGFLAAALKTKQSSLDKPLLPFKRAVIAFHDRHCVITAERSLLGYYSVYTSCSYSAELKDGRLLGKIKAGHLGRLPIHPKLAQYMSPLFGDIWSALDRDVKVVSKLGAIDFQEKAVTLTAPLP